MFSGIAKAGPGQARTRPKQYVCLAHVTWSRAQTAGIQQVPSQHQWPGYTTANVIRIILNASGSGWEQFAFDSTWLEIHIDIFGISHLEMHDHTVATCQHSGAGL